MRSLIAKKVGMTRVPDKDGAMIPVTLLCVEDQVVTKVLTPERDGYSAVQVGYYAKPEKRLGKADIYRQKKAGIADKTFSRFKEFRTESHGGDFKVGDALKADLLDGVMTVDITGITKGRGFEGAITRWGHSTGRRTHGSHFHRRPGSLGQRTTPGYVYKNKKMPGHMGDVQRTVQNLKVVFLDAEKSIIAVKGSVPGCRDGFVVVRRSVKAK